MGSAALARVGNYNIGDMIQLQKDWLRARKFTALGRITNIRLGVDSRAAYFNADAWKRVCPKTKVMGLQLEWPAEIAPWCGFAEDRQTLLFLNGIQECPRVSASIMRAVEDELRDGAVLKHQSNQVPRISQYIEDYASGKMLSRDGWQYAICQPVEQIAVLTSTRSATFGTNGTWLRLRGYPIDGRFPALFVGFKKHKTYTEQAAHICHGMVQFEGSESGSREAPQPWLNSQ
jgi:hypothetical protein